MITPTPEKSIVDKMFKAFKSQDLETAVSTVSEDTVWIHHGSQKLPSLRFEGKSGVNQFFATNFNTMQVEYFDILNMIQQGNTIVVTGKEKFTIDGKEGFFAQKWVQIYTVKDQLITRMEEYATSIPDEEYMVVN